MAYVLYTIVQILPQTLIVRSSSREVNVNNVLKASSKLAENVLHYLLDVQLFKISPVFNANRIIS